ncbi:autotransporter outer membrane beta-barrel domain-containing protein [Pseudomonas sp. SWRI153]|uniref:Autotransporter outer membrane beta-barrel domain-containing protein n=1 Tax=Pseudomonas khorasanensis TaxID=2745508 RepID=A0A923F054_9PSED|nr:autotransporter outer membrane beta-barrel domain-containing protein [Pseudomonas khorasanensis]
MTRFARNLRVLPPILMLPAYLLLDSSPASAACSLVAGPGNDAFTCDSGTSSALTDLSGNNSLTLPVNGTGQINGSVTFGAGADRVEINSGVITLSVNQGAGVDDFVMTGGSLGFLAQGDGRDTFLMTGGTIVSAFEDGDIARMTGGTIGRVDMKLDNNFFDLSGGQITGNLVTGFGTDTIIFSGGRIGGNVSVSGGNDSITVTGGEIGGEIRASTGDDRLLWDGGGIIRSAILMDVGSDSATLRNLDDSILALTPRTDGGVGTDRLTFDNVQTALPARFGNWETLDLSNSTLNLGSDALALGDAGTGTGVLNVDDASVVLSTQGAVSPALTGRAVTFNNAGVIDLTRNNSRTDDSLTIGGNYVGSGGQLLLQSVVAGDDSPSDRLVVNNGSLDGATVISVSNVGGAGALTQLNGIQLVQAQGSTVSSDSAFTLNGPVSAGAYDYYLFKGGVTPGTENSWYLRSAVVAPQMISVPNPDPTLPPMMVPVVVTPIAAVAPAGSPPLPVLPAAVAGAAPIPLYRPEVPTWSVLPPAAAQLTLNALGTFHDRQGDQRLLSETGAFGAGWGRIYGKNLDQTWAGTVAPSLDGSLKGFQVGNDLYSSLIGDSLTQRLGFFVGHSRLRGDVDGFNEGFQNNSAGKIKLEGDSYGLYWTLSDPHGWYVDTVVMGTRFDGDNHSDRGVKLDNRGHALTLSAEAGYPFSINDTWVVEPQAQVIHQKISLDSQDDGISRVSFDSDSAWTGRLGARLKGRYQVSGLPVEPYLRANLWHTFSGTDSVTFGDSTVISTQQKSSTADVGLGVILTLDRTVSVFASTDYSQNIDSNDQRGVVGNLGVRVSW